MNDDNNATPESEYGSGYKVNFIQENLIQSISYYLQQQGYNGKLICSNIIALDAPDSMLAIEVFQDGSCEILSKRNLFGKISYKSMKKPFFTIPGKWLICAKRMIDIHKYYTQHPKNQPV